jgi:dihydroorotate dehydrogenase (fumarate)
MANLTTKYLGIELKNPLIIGASNMVTNLDNLKAIEEAGASAIVYKSLFEEQIQLESIQLEDELEEYNERHAEMITLFPEIKHAGPEEFLLNLKKAKEALNIPLFASINGMYKETWVEYAQLIEETGVDGIELNFYRVPDGFNKGGIGIENKQIEVLEAVKKKVKIPVSIKMGPFYANPLNVIAKLDESGANGFVLFNRLFQPDIDIDEMSHTSPFNLSNQGDYKMPLRYTGMLYKNVNASICSNTGIYTGEDVIKMILAGADAVQVVSAIYKNKIPYIATILKEIESWMDKNEFNTLDDFRGKLSKNNTKDPWVYKRAQYIDILLKSDEILKKHPLR